MYHVYAVDLEKEPDWAHWQPKPMRGHEEEVDTSPTELIINGNPLRCVNGQCWVNLEQLCIQCCQKVKSFVIKIACSVSVCELVTLHAFVTIL